MKTQLLLLTLALSLAGAHALAAEPPHQDATESSSCPDAAAAATDPGTANAPKPASTGAAANASPKTKAGSSSLRRRVSPRWHSLLPGMFR